MHDQARYIDYNEARSLDSLLHCRVVVNTQDYVCTGVIKFVEGDILEVELADFKKFKLADTVKVAIYSAFGIINFHSVVVAVAEGAIVVFNPPEIRRRWLLKEKREFVRVDVSEQGTLKSIIRSNSVLKAPMGVDIPVQLENVSLGGIGFTVPEDVQIQTNDVTIIDVDLGHPFSFNTQIVQKRNHVGKQQFYLGARFVELGEEQFIKLKSLVMHGQINQYYQTKKQAGRTVW